MEIQTETPPAPPTELPAIVAVSDVIAVEAITSEVQALAEKIQRNLPGLDWAWCVVCAELNLAAKRRGRRVDPDAETRLEMLQHRRRSMTARRSA